MIVICMYSHFVYCPLSIFVQEYLVASMILERVSWILINILRSNNPIYLINFLINVAQILVGI